MIIGSPQKFAIEYCLDENHGGAWLFGKICYWINGERIGDFDLGTSLRDVFIHVHPIIKDSGKRKIDTQSTISPAEIFNEIDDSLYDSEVASEAKHLPLESPGRFNVRVPVDVFDDWKIYLLEKNDSELILYKHSSATNARSFELCKGIFDSVMASFYEELDKLHEKECKSN